MSAVRPTLALAAGLLAAVLAIPAHAGGPQIVNGAGQPLVWALDPVPFNPDRGSLGALSNAAVVGHLVADAAVWTAVPTATVTLTNGEPLPVDVTIHNYPTYLGACGDGLSPVIFDTDGSITDDIYGEGANNHIIGFAGINCGTYVPPSVTEGLAVLNGRFLDGIDNASNPELSPVEFDAVMIHEFGHYLGLDHSQVGLAQAFDGDPSNDAAIATMFPILVNATEMSSLHLDDRVAISTLYPDSSFATDFGTITGTIFLANGATPFQGANVIARAVGDPLVTAVSQVSGARYFPLPPDRGGPPPSTLLGLFELVGLPAADYTVEIENVFPAFVGGSSVGPVDLPVPVPGPAEFWNGANEAGTSPPDDPADAEAITVTAGTTTSNIDVIVNQYPPPPNDECDAATDIASTPFTDTTQTASATTGAFDPLQSCTSIAGSQNANSVWYRYVPPADGVITASTAGSTYDTVVSVEGGGCGAFTELACNDNTDQTAQSALALGVTAGVPVYVEITGRSSGGSLQFAFDFLPLATCPPAPVGGCRNPVAVAQSPLKIRGGGDPAARLAVWKWGKGAATTLAEFGAPTTLAGTSYAFCLYDGGGTPVGAARIPLGGQCGASGQDCWRASSKKLKYRDKDLTPDGVKSLDLIAGVGGKATIKLKAVGALFAPISLPLVPPVTAQLVSSAGTCWEAQYGAAGIHRNDGAQFTAKDQ